MVIDKHGCYYNVKNLEYLSALAEAVEEVYSCGPTLDRPNWLTSRLQLVEAREMAQVVEGGVYCVDLVMDVVGEEAVVKVS